MVVIGINFILNVIFLNIFPPKIKGLVVVGYIILGLGGLFVTLSLVTLLRKGVDTVIDSGIFCIIRHPMYLGGILLFVSHLFIGQHWLIAINTMVASYCCYLTILSGDERNLEKFGEAYKQYMELVPRINFIYGIIRCIRRGM